jgi:Pyruvate/2-oxoacid:ferredoxin oxidoreductase delta subunit
MRATLFICRAHGVNPMVMRGLLKDPRVGYSQIMPRCCSPEGRDQIALHLRGRSTQALLVVGCSPLHLEGYLEMAESAGLPPHRVALVPAASCHTAHAAELALARVLDPREVQIPPTRRERGVLIVGEGASAQDVLSQLGSEDVEVVHLDPSEVLVEGTGLLGGPGHFTLGSGEDVYSFGTAVLALDWEVKVNREVLGECEGTLVLLTGGEECATALLEELDDALEKGGKVYAAMDETPFPGTLEGKYLELQARGVTFLRTSEVMMEGGTATLRDEHLGEEIRLDVGRLVTVGSERPPSTDPLLRMFGMPAGWKARGLVPGESGVPGVYLAGSVLTAFHGPEMSQAARAVAVAAADELRCKGERTPLASIETSRCSLCLTCLRLCPYRAPRLEEGVMVISPERCRGCGMCLAMCPGLAIDMAPTDLRGEVGGTVMGPRRSS